MRERGIAVAWVDDEKYPAIEEVTADFVYLRLRRCVEDEPAGYPTDAHDKWAARLRSWSEEGRDCFLYFINGAKIRAPNAAQALISAFAVG